MKKITAVAYLVAVRELNARKSENLTLGSFNKADSLRDVVLKLLQKHSELTLIKEFQRAFTITISEHNDESILCGYINLGEYGTSSKLINIDDGSISHEKTKFETDPTPFYFYMSVPSNRNKGILILQQIGVSGAKGVLDSVVTFKFNALYPEYRLHIDGLTIADEMQRHIEHGAIEEIIVEKHEIPADIADKFTGKSHSYEGKISFSVKPKNPEFFRRGGLLSYVKGEKTIADVFELDDLGFDIVKSKVKLGDHVRTLNLSKPAGLTMLFDVTKDLTLGADGFPTEESLHKQFSDIATGLAAKGGFQL